MSTTQAALLEALTNARDIIATDRQDFVDCHQVRNDELIHEAGALGLVLVGEGAWIAPEDAEPLHDYDRALAKIDAALRAAEAAQPPNLRALQPACRYISDVLKSGTATEKAVARKIMHLLPLDTAEAAQPEPLTPEYGATDYGFTFAGLPLTEGDKRLAALLTQALGNDHPAFDDLVALFFAARATPQPAPIAAQAGAPTIEAAHDMGAKGGPAVEAERLEFEAWMRGHCWALGADWTGTEYRCDSEQSGMVSPAAMRTRQLWAVWRDRAALAAQAGPAQAPLTDEQIDKLMREIGRKIEGHILVPGVPMHGDWPVYYRAKVRAAIAIAAQAPASTRPADASISGQRVDVVPMTREQILRAAVAAMPATNPLVADDLIEGHTMHTEADDIIAIWNAAIAAAPQAPAEPAAQAVDYLFTTAKQKGLRAGDGELCPNDHDPDCRWPQCNCRATPAAREAGTTAGN